MQSNLTELDHAIFELSVFFEPTENGRIERHVFIGVHGDAVNFLQLTNRCRGPQRKLELLGQGARLIFEVTRENTIDYGTRLRLQELRSHDRQLGWRYCLAVE